MQLRRFAKTAVALFTATALAFASVAIGAGSVRADGTGGIPPIESTTNPTSPTPPPTTAGTSTFTQTLGLAVQSVIWVV